MGTSDCPVDSDRHSSKTIRHRTLKAAGHTTCSSKRQYPLSVKTSEMWVGVVPPIHPFSHSLTHACTHTRTLHAYMHAHSELPNGRLVLHLRVRIQVLIEDAKIIPHPVENFHPFWSFERLACPVLLKTGEFFVLTVTHHASVER